MKSISWWRNDLVRTYSLSPETVMMLSDVDVRNVAYRISEGF
jgi:hypothetical protein